MRLAERKRIILAAIVEAYIATGEPVGSKTLAAMTDMGLSSATIRNEMSELAELGFLEQPHTSAGRVPSEAGYRYYVDSLMGRRSLSRKEIQEIDSLLSIGEGDIERVLEQAGRALAQITGFAALSTAPQGTNVSVCRVELIPAGRRSALLLLVTDSGLVRSRLCRAEDDLTPEMYTYFTRLIEEKLAGKPVESITPEVITEIAGELYEYKFALSPFLRALKEETANLSQSEVFLGGEANLLNPPEIGSGPLHQILSMIDRREELLKLIDGIKNGVEVRIGTENGLQFMNDSSVVAAPYVFKGKTAGNVGIIGPKRMDYARMVPSIEYFSMALSRLINNAFGSL